MPVRVSFVGGGANEPVVYLDGSNTKDVKDDLLRGFGKGILKQNRVGVLSEYLAPGDYDYDITTQQGQLFLPP
jgi:hypothetical protein